MQIFEWIDPEVNGRIKELIDDLSNQLKSLRGKSEDTRRKNLKIIEIHEFIF